MESGHVEILKFCALFWLLGSTLVTPQQVVTRNFLKALFMPEVEELTRYTTEKCIRAGIQFNTSLAMDGLDDCIQEDVLPQTARIFADSFIQMKATLTAILKAKQVKDIIPINEEDLRNFCQILPEVFNCFLKSKEMFSGVNKCWDSFHIYSYVYVNRLFPAFCDNQKLIRRNTEELFMSTYVSCLKTYANSFHSCVEFSKVRFGSLCGVIPCFRKVRCGRKSFDRTLSDVFNLFHEESCCEDESICDDEPDPCAEISSKLKALMDDEEVRTDFKPFFNTLDDICDEWNATKPCTSKNDFKWKPILESQCETDFTDNEMSPCKRLTIPTRVTLLSNFCSGSEKLPTVWNENCRRILETMNKSRTEGSSVSTANLYPRYRLCSTSPSMAAKESEDIGALAWGLIAFAFGILLISFFVHAVGKRKKTRSFSDANDDSAVSIHLKETTLE